jgi:hypothetical protein
MDYNPYWIRRITMKTIHKITACVSILAATIFISAQSDGQRGPHKPPQEAIDACKDKADNDSCTFTGRNQDQLEGTCHKGPDGQGELACHPKPPKEALDACQGKAERDACSFTGRNQENVQGTCMKGPKGEGELACRPEHMPKPMDDQGAPKN